MLHHTSLLAQAANYDKNVLKVHITPVLLNNYGIQYERMLTSGMSVALSGRWMPGGQIPMYNTLKPLLGDLSALTDLYDFRVGGSAVVPEIRFYLGKSEGPRGFYLAPYVSFSNYSVQVDNFEFSLGSEPEGQISSKYANLDSRIRGVTGGLMIGAQWQLGKMIYLDWWMIGASYGQANGKLAATTTETLSAEWQEELRSEIENIEVPFLKFDTEVHAHGVRATLKGPWAGIKGGLSVGIKF